MVDNEVITMDIFFYEVNIFQIRKFKKGEIEVKKKISDQIAFVIFFAVIIGLIVYSVNDLLFN